MNRIPFGICLGVWSMLLAFAAPACASDAEEPPIDFMRDIRPILAQNCFMCHGPDETTREGGLRLDIREGFLAEADSGEPAVVPGDPAASELLVRVTAEEDYLRMPPAESGRTLSEEELDLLRRWIEQGAVYEEHWSFQPPRLSDVPKVQNGDWPRNEIDHFILARLEREGIEPSPEADRVTLIRRLSLDLLGLPPSPEQVDEFLRDDRPDAYEQLVDRLLDSPHFGERWGRHWLDLARYADSDGYLGDSLRPYAYKYRDWVIDAVNRDLPFDEFTVEQIAGDLLPDATLEQKIATGFHRNSMKNTEAGADREEDRVHRTVDRVATTGTVWLGLTLGCAECHTHKFDPISHEEFFQLYAFFNDLEDKDLPAASSEELARYESQKARWDEQIGAVRESIEELVAGEQDESEGDESALEEILQLLAQPIGKRKDEETDRLEAFLERFQQEERELFSQYEMLAQKEPSPPKTKAPTVATASKPRETRIHLRGDFRSPGDLVEPATLGVLHPLEPRGEKPDRLDLARWLVDENNPLTPRTAVNQVWKHLFGRGLVHSMDDFGTTGEAPSHPALLDWLAVTFRENGWSRKSLIRTIVTSSTYRQVSHVRPELQQRDPFNTLLARQFRFRLEAEVIRDASLEVSGLLDLSIGGPSIRPPMNSQITAISRNKDWKVSPGSEKYRRGMYILFRRGTPYPMLTTFDAPDSTVSCARRERSNSPLQSLTLLNDPVFFECAQQLGRRLTIEGGEEPEAWIRHAYRLCLAREPRSDELARALEFIDEQRELAAEADENRLNKLVGQPVPDADLNEQAVRVAFARVLTNLDEFITRE
jgi:mono/diheme cytochrome c family protein